MALRKGWLGELWREIADGNPRARQLADRHYSRKTKGATLFIGPGEKIILATLNYDALFAWRKTNYRMDGQLGIECTIFRNESNCLSSAMIQEACLWAWQKWPRERLFTYVKDAAIRSANPGYCFKMAGWKKCGRNKFGKLTILENINYTDMKPVIVGPVQMSLWGRC